MIDRYIAPALLVLVVLMSACSREGPGDAAATPSPEAATVAGPIVAGSRFVFTQKSPAQPDSTLLLFVHGLWPAGLENTWTHSNGNTLWGLTLSQPEFAKGFDAFALGFPSTVLGGGSFNIEEAAGRLLEVAEHEHFTKKYQRIIIVAHSMGGLIAVRALVTSNLLRNHVPLVYTYATPYHGARVATVVSKILGNPA